jgi:GAF domain-containing protein
MVNIARTGGLGYVRCSAMLVASTGYAADPDRLLSSAATPRLLEPLMLGFGLILLICISFLMWSRERRVRRQRERLRKAYNLGEEILSASSPETILKRVSASLTAVLGVSRVHLYVYNGNDKTLDSLPGENSPKDSISVASAPAGTEAGAVACFHYRTPLAIPDIERSPFPISPRDGERPPKSLLFVPMLAQGEVTGVLELDQDDRSRDFSLDEQELAQHLASQIGVAFCLLDQRSVQEQLFRTEKLAAVGRLLSGVVSELQAPLASISDLARLALEKSRGFGAEREVAAIASEAESAAAMVTRLVSFAAEQAEARPVSVTSLLHNLIEFREGDRKASGIKVRDLTAPEPLYVMGSYGQLEQVFLNLLVHAELSLANAPQKVITVRTSILAKRLVVEVAFTAQPVSRTPEETAAVLGLTRSVIAGHGGEVRLIEKSHADPRFEVELPLTAARERTPPAPPSSRGNIGSRGMTALVIDPDETAQRQLLGLLAARGHRVVPVANADTGLELAQRIRIDAAFCSLHAPGLNWVELSERMQPRVGGFILLSDGYDAELASNFEGYNRYVLAKPIQEAELERVMRDLEPVTPLVK